jgi:putative Mg2+ transporter-C (MgtC) family protein
MGDDMQSIDIFIRISLAIVVGGFVGYEREMRNRPAGFITHTLVCVGATVVALIQLQMVHDTAIMISENPLLAPALKADIGRVVAQVITGVGFLGAGTIIFDKGSVKGLTTATTLWVVACLGLSIGLGYYRIAIISAVMVIFIIVVLKRLETNYIDKKFKNKIEVLYYSKTDDFIENSVEYFRKNTIQVRDIKFKKNGNEEIKICVFTLYCKNAKNIDEIITDFEKKEFILKVNFI